MILIMINQNNNYDNDDDEDDKEDILFGWQNISIAGFDHLIVYYHFIVKHRVAVRVHTFPLIMVFISISSYSSQMSEHCWSAPQPGRQVTSGGEPPNK